MEYDLLSKINAIIRQQAEVFGEKNEINLLVETLNIARNFQNKLDSQLYQELRISLFFSGIIRIFLMDEYAGWLRKCLLRAVSQNECFKNLTVIQIKKILKKVILSFSKEYMFKGSKECDMLKKLFNIGLGQIRYSPKAGQGKFSYTS